MNTNLKDSADFERKMKLRLFGMRKKFIDDKLEMLNSLDVNLNEQNLEKVQTLGHQLMGRAATFSYEYLSLLGEKIENAAKNKQLKALESYLDELRKLLENEAISQE